MNRNFVLIPALTLGLMTSAALGQAAGPQAPAPAPAPVAPAAPQAIPAKIAIVQFEQAAAATNEGQRAIQELTKKYEPKKAELDALAVEIETLTKQLQAAPASMPEDERGSRQRAIETKQKQYQRDGEDAQNSYGADLQEAVGKVAQKMGPVIVKYVQTNGYTMLLDSSAQQGGLTLMWGGTDISQAVVDAYNTSSGVAAPVPSAPSASRARPQTAAPKPAAPKPPAPKP